MYCGFGVGDGILWGSASISGAAGSTGRVKVNGGVGVIGAGAGAGAGAGGTVIGLGGRDGAGGGSTLLTAGGAFLKSTTSGPATGSRYYRQKERVFAAPGLSALEPE